VRDERRERESGERAKDNTRGTGRVLLSSSTAPLPPKNKNSFPAVRELDLSRVRRLSPADLALLPEFLPGLVALRLRASGSGGNGASSSSSSASAGPLREAALAPIGRLTRLERLSVRGAHRCRWAVLRRWHGLVRLRSLELMGLSNGDAAAGGGGGLGGGGGIGGIGGGGGAHLADFLAATGAATRLTRLVLGDAMGLSFMGDAGLLQLGVKGCSSSSAAEAAAGNDDARRRHPNPNHNNHNHNHNHRHHCPLRTLDLTGCIDVTDAGLVSAARAASSTLEELSLHNCLRVTAGGLAAALALPAAGAVPLPPPPLLLPPPPPPPSPTPRTRLARLSLRGCSHLDDASLAPVLASLTALTWLSLQSCGGVRGQALLALAPGVVARLGCGGNGSRDGNNTDNGDTTPTATRPGCLRLRHLVLSNCSGLVLGEDGRPAGAAASAAAAAAAANSPPLASLALLPHLESLDLSACHGVSQGALQGLSKCPALAELRLAGWKAPVAAAAEASDDDDATEAAAAVDPRAAPLPLPLPLLPSCLRSLDLRGARFASPLALAGFLRRATPLDGGQLASLDLSRAAVTAGGGGGGAAAAFPRAPDAAAHATANAATIATTSGSGGALAPAIEAIASRMARLEALDLSDVRVVVVAGVGATTAAAAAAAAAVAMAAGDGGDDHHRHAPPPLPPPPPALRRSELAPLGKLERLRVLRLSGVVADEDDNDEEEERQQQQQQQQQQESSSSSAAADATAAALRRALLLAPGGTSSVRQDDHHHHHPHPHHRQSAGPRALRGIAPSMMNGAYGRQQQAAVVVEEAVEAAAEEKAAASSAAKAKAAASARTTTTAAAAAAAVLAPAELLLLQQQEEQQPRPPLLLLPPLADSTAADAASVPPPPPPPLPALPPIAPHALWLTGLAHLQEFAVTDSPGVENAYLIALAAGAGASLRAADFSGCKVGSGGGGGGGGCGGGSSKSGHGSNGTKNNTATTTTATTPATPSPQLLACFLRMPKLELLDVSGCRAWGDADVTAAAASLPALRSLALRSCPFVGDGALAALGSAQVSRATRLRELAVSGTRRVTCAGVAALGGGVGGGGGGVGSNDEAATPPPPLQHLESLSLDYCPELTDAGLEALAREGSRALPRLRTVSVRGCWRLGDSGAGALLRPLAAAAAAGGGGGGGAARGGLPSLARLSVEGCHRLTAKCCELAAERDGLLARWSSGGQQQPQSSAAAATTTTATTTAATAPPPPPPPPVPASGIVRVECVGRRPTAIERTPLAAWEEQLARRQRAGGGGGAIAAAADAPLPRSLPPPPPPPLFHIV
jgi:hypothetical protein